MGSADAIFSAHWDHEPPCASPSPLNGERAGVRGEKVREAHVLSRFMGRDDTVPLASDFRDPPGGKIISLARNSRIAEGRFDALGPLFRKKSSPMRASIPFGKRQRQIITPIHRQTASVQFWGRIGPCNTLSCRVLGIERARRPTHIGTTKRSLDTRLLSYMEAAIIAGSRHFSSKSNR